MTKTLALASYFLLLKEALNTALLLFDGGSGVSFDLLTCPSFVFLNLEADCCLLCLVVPWPRGMTRLVEGGHFPQRGRRAPVFSASYLEPIYEHNNSCPWPGARIKAMT